MDVHLNTINSFVEKHAPENWVEAKMTLTYQPNSGSLSCTYKNPDGTVTALDTFETPYTEEVWDSTVLLHTENSGADNKWNKAEIIFYPNREPDFTYSWDQEYQDEIDEANRVEMKKDPNYNPPKWHWEE